MDTYFTSDTHFGHGNIIKYSNRPFASVEAMNDTIIDNINKRVGPNDRLFHLGDFAFRGEDPSVYRARIRCKNIVLILGNHDPQSRSGTPDQAFASLFESVHQLTRIRVPYNGQTQHIVLCHYAMRVWDRSHHGAWHLYGHSHASLPDDPHALSFDVGVDAQHYRPLSVHEVGEIMARKQYVPVDHHGARD